LQIPEAKERVIAAGIPWFATMFGRDSIIAAYQSLSLNPQLAIETLRTLAHYQGREINDWRDEQPGKILHEYRTGEMTRNGEMPFGPYYGSVDATPLFLILFSETFNWTADEKLVRDLLPAAYRALEWIATYGDLDGDGFVEYIRRSPRGLANQGWKDSWDANMHRDGTIARPPIALVEVQGYVYDAKYRMSSLLRAFGDTVNAERLKREASDLAKRIEKAYWMSSRGFYAMALDGEKKQLQVIASNPGHLLWNRAISKDRSRAVVNRFMRDDMFSGWGLRTMSAEERVFNPLSYHRGSVWPHDNSLVVHGMALNEFRGPALRVLTTLFQAALRFRDYRLPELFCGVQRREYDDPVHYPVSCSPQAWASGALFLMLNSVLGIRPSAQRKELNIVNPELPDWLEHLHIRNLRIGQSRVGLDFARRGARTFCNVVDVEGEKLLVNVAFKK
jgi:glycogen debranching enzyme